MGIALKVNITSKYLLVIACIAIVSMLLFAPWSPLHDGEGSGTRCWKCENNEPIYQDFPSNTTCGEGNASLYPFTEEPDCSR